MKDCLNILLGEGNPEELLPDIIEPEILIDEILGFEDMDGIKEMRENDDNEEYKEEESKYKDENV